MNKAQQISLFDGDEIMISSEQYDDFIAIRSPPPRSVLLGSLLIILYDEARIAEINTDDLSQVSVKHNKSYSQTILVLKRE